MKVRLSAAIGRGVIDTMVFMSEESKSLSMKQCSHHAEYTNEVALFGKRLYEQSYMVFFFSKKDITGNSETLGLEKK